MICSKCQEQGLKSKIYPGGTIVTSMYCEPFYDEEGKYHLHDSNIQTTSFRCSHEHYWNVKKSGGKCPNCDYGDEPEVVLYK